MIVLYLMLLVIGISMLVAVAGFDKYYDKLWFQILYSSIFAEEIIIDWTIAYDYTKVTIETRALLDKEIHLNNFRKLQKVDNQKRLLGLAWIPLVALSLIVAALEFWAFHTPVN
jgi:hypothetical protein